jgi:hypothetical protein
VRIEVAVGRTLVQEQFVRIEIELQRELVRIAGHLMAVRIEVADLAVHMSVAAVDHSFRAPPVPLDEFRIDFRNYFAVMKLPWNWADRIS